MRAQFGQRGVGLLGQQMLQPLFPLLAEQRLASTQVCLWLQRAPLPKLLAHAPHRRDAKTRKLRDLPSAFAQLVEFENSLADRNRYGSQGYTLPRRRALVKLHYVWKYPSWRQS